MARSAPVPFEQRLTLTIEDAAHYLSLTRAQVQFMITHGQIPHVKLGRRVLVPTTELIEYVRTNTTRNQPPPRRTTTSKPTRAGVPDPPPSSSGWTR